MKKISMLIPEVKDYRMAEGLNQLKVNIEFTGKDINTIMITAALEGEGKSTTAIYLANTLAQNGKRVLLVDADLRNSKLVAEYEIKGAKKGLTHYLTGQSEIEDVIYETDKEGFYITVAGPLPMDPTGLLQSESFEEYMDRVKEDFDYVIVDTSPLGLVVDAAIIGKHCDGAVVLVKQGGVSRKHVQNVVKQLKRYDIRILGAVLSQTSDRGRGYGYGYGQYNDYWKNGQKN